MRNFFFSLCFLFSSQLVFAQVGPGLFAGGQIGISSSSTSIKTSSSTIDGGQSLSFSILPKVGYFFSDNVGGGLMLGYGSASNTLEIEVLGVTTTTETSTTAWQAGLFGRYAHSIGDGSFFLIGDLNLMLEGVSGESTTTIGTNSTTADTDPQSIITVGLSPALLFFPTDKIGLELGLGNIIQFQNNTTTSSANSDNKTVVNNIELLNLNTLGLSLGASYYFAR